MAGAARQNSLHQDRPFALLDRCSAVGVPAQQHGSAARPGAEAAPGSAAQGRCRCRPRAAAARPTRASGWRNDLPRHWQLSPARDGRQMWGRGRPVEVAPRRREPASGRLPPPGLGRPRGGRADGRDRPACRVGLPGIRQALRQPPKVPPTSRAPPRGPVVTVKRLDRIAWGRSRQAGERRRPGDAAPGVAAGSEGRPLTRTQNTREGEGRASLDLNFRRAAIA